MSAELLRVITIASGKGGVGKTNISLNLALSLIKAGNRVCLLDADIGMANVDVLLGLSHQHSLMDFIEGKHPFSEIVSDGPESLKIIPGGTALDRLLNLAEAEKERLNNIFGYLKDFDDLVIDVSSGLSDTVLHFLEAADIPVVVIVPEPTSLLDAYALIKMYGARGYTGPVSIIVNQVKSKRHATTVFKKFKEAVDRYLEVSIRYLGHIFTDANVGEAVIQQTPFTRLFPDSTASLCVKKISETICSKPNNISRGEGLNRLLSYSEPIELDHDDSVAPEHNDDVSASDNHENVEDIIRLLMVDGHITQSQVDYAKKIQEKLDTPVRFLEILKDLGYLKDSQIEETLLKHRTNIRLGSLLVELGYITEDQLSMVLNQQMRNPGGKRIGELLVENHFISEYDLTQVLALNLGFPYVKPELESLDHSLLSKAPLKFFYKNQLLPLEKDNEVVKIALADPLDPSALYAATNIFGSNINIVISTQKEIHDALSAYDAWVKQKEEYKDPENDTGDIFEKLIAEALKKRVSDIHIEPYVNQVRIRFRRDGSLIHHTDLPMELMASILNRIKVLSAMDITEKRRHQEGRFSMTSPLNGDEIEIRVSFYVSVYGEKIVMHILGKKDDFCKLSHLGMGGNMLDRFREEVLDIPNGIVIFTGPTNAGKTTTLYAAINHCNNSDTCIVTAEDPVEYALEGITQCSIEPKIGRTYDDSLKHLLNQDPDIVILGEIGDKLSADHAIQAALTGHKVMTTFHTEDSVSSLLRLMHMDIETFLISSTISSVIGQRLLKKICPHCQSPYTPTAKDLRRLNYQHQNIREYNFLVGKGCSQCDYSGYSGRIGVFEMLVLNEHIKEAVLARKSAYEMRRICMETTGLSTLLEDGIYKAACGLTSIHEVLRCLPLVETPRPIEHIQRLIGKV